MHARFLLLEEAGLATCAGLFLRMDIDNNKQSLFIYTEHEKSEPALNTVIMELGYVTFPLCGSWHLQL